MKNILNLIRLFKPYRGFVVISIIVSQITLLANVTLMAISGWFIASMALAGSLGLSMNYFTPAAIIRACAIFRTAGRYLERLISHEVTFRVLSALRLCFFEAIEPLAPAYLSRYRSGDLLSRIQADIDLLNEFYLRIFIPVVVAVISIILFIVFMFFYYPPLALVQASLLIFSGFIFPYLLAKSGQQTGKHIVKHTTTLRTVLVDSFQGMGENLIYNSQEKQLRQINNISQQLGNEQRKLSRLNGFSLSGVALIANFAMWLVLLMVIPQVNQGHIPPAELAMLALFTLASFEAVQSLPQAFQIIGITLEAADRIFSLMAEEQPCPQQKAQGINHCDIKFNNVDFRYHEDQQLILRQLDFDIRPQQKLAIVGASGSGKSSLINLLLGFWTPEKGDIFIDDINYREINTESIRQNFSLVPQTPFLFNSSIKQNLLLAKSDASQEEIEQVCRIAHIDREIQSLEDAYDTVCGVTGTRFSGGQIKRIAIARALLKDAPVVILDEPGENLDSALAQKILHEIYQTQTDKTIILITHDLKLLDKMDDIMVMEQGKIIDRGDFQQLLHESRIFKSLYDLLFDFNQLSIPS